MIKSRYKMGVVVLMCCCFVFGSMKTLAAAYSATPSWSKKWYSSDVTFKATTVGNIEARGYYAFALAALRSSNGSELACGGKKTSYVPAEAIAVEVFSETSYDNSQARKGYAEYGISSDRSGDNKVPGQFISMEYNNIYPE